MSRRQRSALRASLLWVVMAAVSGCTSETQDGDTTVFRWDWWLPLLVLAGGIVTCLLGLVLGRVSATSAFVKGLLARLSLTFTFLGPLVCLVLVPTLYKDELTVSKEGFTLREGIWWSPTVHDVSFADVARIGVIEKKARGSGSPEYDLVCHRRGGGVLNVPDHGLVRRGGAARILEAARERGIPIEENATYAAIAYSPETGAHGAADNCLTRAEAERLALERCKSEGARVVVWVRNEWCALAVGEDRAYGYARARTAAEAERRALAHCREYTKTPTHIAVSVFSGKPRAVKP